MNENLTDMVQSNEPTTPDIFSEADLDLPAEETQEASEEETTHSAVEDPTDEVSEESTEITVGTAYLTDWFEQYGNIFEPDIKQLKTKIRGLDPRSDIIVVLPHESHEQLEDGTQKKKVELFKRANEQKVIDLPGISMNVYNNGFRIIYQYSEDLFLKAYGIKTGLIVSFCNKINNQLLPYELTKLKKDEDSLIIKFKDQAEVLASLGSVLDKEELQLLYKQTTKVIDEFTSKQNVIDWLITRQESITDINHHLQIDGVLTTILS